MSVEKHWEMRPYIGRSISHKSSKLPTFEGSYQIVGKGLQVEVSSEVFHNIIHILVFLRSKQRWGKGMECHK